MYIGINMYVLLYKYGPVHSTYTPHRSNTQARPHEAGARVLNDFCSSDERKTSFLPL